MAKNPTFSIPKCLKKLTNHPQDFTSNDAAQCIHQIMSGNATPAQIASFLTCLKYTKLERNPDILVSIVQTMRSYALSIPYSESQQQQTASNKGNADSPNKKIKLHGDQEKEFKQEITFPMFVDIVGTGGDGQNTFNVSTASAIVAAGAGCQVAKHGNRASSSSCGSGDVLEALGADIVGFSPLKVANFLSQSRIEEKPEKGTRSDERGRFCFLFSQTFHPAMKHVASIRKELGFRTIFNILGPLINPTNPKRIIVGVSQPDLGKLMAETLLLDGIEFGWVVHGKIGLDEISPEGETLVWEVKKGVKNSIQERVIKPFDFGLKEHSLSSVKGGDAKENSSTMESLLKGLFKDGPEEKDHPIVDFVCLNTAALLYVAGMAKDFKEGVQLARDSISSGKALACLNEFVDATKKNL